MQRERKNLGDDGFPCDDKHDGHATQVRRYPVFLSVSCPSFPHPSPEQEHETGMRTREGEQAGRRQVSPRPLFSSFLSLSPDQRPKTGLLPRVPPSFVCLDTSRGARRLQYTFPPRSAHPATPSPSTIKLGKRKSSSTQDKLSNAK